MVTVLAQQRLVMVSATRLSQEQFLSESALGMSLAKFFPKSNVELKLYTENSQGLSKVYNHAISSCETCLPGAFLFIHDDVYLNDYFWLERVWDALTHYDVVGLAGNKKIYPNQYSWLWNGENRRDAEENLSGRVGHGKKGSYANISAYGKTPNQVKLIDGLFMAVKGSLFENPAIRFDPQFEFDFYDLDFCRTVENYEKSIGTWPIAVTHESGGSLGSSKWLHGAEKYRNKWFK
jgi:Glycosyltransferase like family